MRVGILHAYSRSNAGDGWLVDLAVERLQRVGVPREDLLVVAMDPPSFTGLESVGFGTTERRLTAGVARAALRSIGGVAQLSDGETPLDDILRGCSAVVGVGGGYLRAVTPVEQAGVAINHLPQLSSAVRSLLPTVYLPQSIGPLRGPVGRRVAARLALVDVVCVRDRASVEELRLGNVARFPDMAVMAVAEQPAASRDGEGVAVIARRLPSRRYSASLVELAAILGDTASWFVQAEGPTEKSDAEFYRELGVTGAQPSIDLGTANLGALVSVRLHGALAGIASGIPTIHLAYTRKGFGAFEDLGLSDFVHSAFGFSPALVAHQAEALTLDPSKYWEAFERHRPRLMEDSERLSVTVAGVLGEALG